MENLKIRVMTEQESREAQELFFELGYGWRGVTPENSIFIPKKLKEYFIINYENTKDMQLSGIFDNSETLTAHKEITLPQLRDMVVLHRNDAGDATHESDTGRKGYLSNEWVENLISGKEALIALANGRDIQYRHGGGEWVNFGINLNEESSKLMVVDVVCDFFEFRLKPRTIKIGDVEVPAPFEPKGWEDYWYLHSDSVYGYAKSENYEQGAILSQFGAWRTESEIKQVVAALRKLIGV